MNEVIGTLIPLALGVALNPFPIILVVLLLGSAQPAANGLAFLTGWIVGLSAVVAVLTLVMNAFESPDGGEPSTITGIVQLLLGAGLLFLAGRKFTKRMRTSDAGPLPRWMASAETMAPARSFAMGLILSAVNPKNFIITTAAGVTIGAAELALTAEIWAMLAYLFIASLAVLIPVSGYLIAPQKMTGPLSTLMAWLRSNHSIMTGILLVVFGFILIGNGIGSF